MNKEEAIKFIERHIPILVKNRKGKGQFPYVSVNAQRQVIEHLADVLVKRNVVLDDVIKCDCKLERHERAKMELDYNKCMDCKKQIQ